MKAHAGSKKKKKTRTKSPEFHESMSSVVDTRPEFIPSVVRIRPNKDGLVPKFNEPMFSVVETKLKEESGSGKRKKGLVVRLSEEILEYMVKEPYGPPYQRRPIHDFELMEIQEKLIAEDEAVRAARDNVLRQYKDRGYAEMLLEVTDDEE
ncbi:hypothetical protein PR202_ga02429 [Eleusine coracana subsp. coracana]|uniref:Uncharacterized protein n=1 Tax=Eleusine coracana subsp. coracana TaxID=191504 RepID=A0AAV5BLL8_ELECO|nr:hypothetical protein PR202_ga02429 [Eleusine coracana subsp. coracana]